MAEKILNTRIQLKRDSLTNWNQSSVVLKPGEVGVAYVDVATKDAKGNIIHVPTALLKVGENVEGSTKTFKELPFVSAVAADVYAWAKKEGIEVIDEGTGEVISDVAWDSTKNALVLTRIDVVTPAEQTETLKSYYTKSEIDTKIQSINNTNSGLADRVQALEDLEAEYGDIVNHNVSEFATAAQGTKADNAAAAIATYGDIVTHNVAEFAPADIDTGVHAVSLTGGTNNGTVKLTVDGTATDNIAVTGLGDAAYTTVSALNATAKGYADAVEAKLPTSADYGVLGVTAGDDTITIGGTAQNPTVKVTADKFDAHGAAAAVEAKLADYTKTVDLDTTIDGYGYLKADDIANKADKATTLAGYGITDAYTKTEADAAFATPAEVIAEVNKALADVSDADSITNITTLVEYVNENAADLTALISEVYGNAEMTGDSRVDKAVTNAANAVATANGADAIANEAKEIADAAKTTAEEAKTAATNASDGAAASAQAAANSAAEALASQNAAKTSETNAKTSETNAANSANAASASANTAGEKATEASGYATDAKGAQSASEAAQAKAEAAQAAAEAARDAAAEFEIGASDFETQAEQHKKDAEAAKTAAVAAQAAAEQAKADAVAAKEAAEASNTSATAIANQAKTTADGAKTAANAATEAVSKLHAIATSGNVNDLVQDAGDVLVFDCGTSTTVL